MERHCACGYEDGTCDRLCGVYSTPERALAIARIAQGAIRNKTPGSFPDLHETIGGPQGLSPYDADNWRGFWVDEQEVVE
jgi:hypothetical protein